MLNIEMAIALFISSLLVNFITQKKVEENARINAIILMTISYVLSISSIIIVLYLGITFITNLF